MKNETLRLLALPQDSPSADFAQWMAQKWRHPAQAA
jgi:hypothetical protein